MAENVTPEEAIRILQAHIASGPQAGPYVVVLYRRYRRAVRRTLRTWPSIASRFRTLLPFFGRRRVTEITAELCAEYVARRAEGVTRLGRPTSPATRNRELAALRAMFNWAIEAKVITEHHITNLHLEKERNIRKTVLREDPIRELLAAAAEHPHGELLRAIILVAWDSGMRRLEVFRLRWDQIADDGEVTLGADETKTDQPRHPRLTQRALEALRALPRSGSPFCFANPHTGEPYTPRIIYGWYERAVKAAGLVGVGGEKVVFHLLRHGYIAANRRMGIPDKITRTATGHRSSASFERYGYPEGEEADLALARREEAIAREALRGGRRRGPQRTSPALKKIVDRRSG